MAVSGNTADLEGLRLSTCSIPVAQQWAALYSASPDVPLLDVSQGVPDSGPHPLLRTALSQVTNLEDAHRYGNILGEKRLRELLAEEMHAVYGQGSDVDITSEDIGLTAGCNLAFYAAVMALASAGDEIILPFPWYGLSSPLLI